MPVVKTARRVYDAARIFAGIIVMSDVPNPWSPENWSLTEQGKYVSKYGVSVAQRKARQAGTKLGALRPLTAAQAIERHWIIQKKVGGGATVGTGGGGTSGDGAPSE